VADNIRFGRPDATRAQVEAAARAIGAEPVILALPHGYDTEVGERGALLLDEATSNLDVATETRVTEAMRRLRQRRTTIVIAHRLSTVIEADQIAVIQDGRVVEAGPPMSCSPAAAGSPTCMTAGSPAPPDRAQTRLLVLTGDSRAEDAM
jgi:ATP-binding cassette subfamily B protein